MSFQERKDELKNQITNIEMKMEELQRLEDYEKAIKFFNEQNLSMTITPKMNEYSGVRTLFAFNLVEQEIEQFGEDDYPIVRYEIDEALSNNENWKKLIDYAISQGYEIK